MLRWDMPLAGPAVVVALLGCDGGGEPVRDPTPLLTPSEQAMRASMAIRGLRPTPDELARVEADAAALPALVDEWLASDAFGATIEDLHAELFLLRDDTNYQLPVQGVLEDMGLNQGDLHRSTVEAPLRLVREVVLEDRPYTDILTADYTVADEVVAAIYGLPFDPAGPAWQHTRWVDGRPQSGLLSDSQIWRRHVSNAANFHRGRANFVSRTFLCEDIGARDVFVAGGVDISDPEAVATAVSTDDGCVACHNALDPLAAFFWGYKEQLQRGAVLTAYDADCEWDWAQGEPPLGNYRVEHWCYPLKFWDVAEADDWEYWGLKPPGYFGQPAVDVTDLGRLIADDPRFAQCTARTFAGYLTQTDRLDVPEAWAQELAGVLEGSAFSARALVKAVVLSEPFLRAASTGPDDFVAGLQTIRPEQVTRTVLDLTGFAWVANEDDRDCPLYGNECWETVDLANSDVYGFRSMMGGIDGYTVTTPVHTPTPTMVLALGQLADEAAGFVVEQDFLLPAADRKLLGAIEAGDTGEPAVRAQIALLYRRVLGEDLATDAEDVTLSYLLWQAATVRTADPREGWRVVISALLRDPRMVFY